MTENGEVEVPLSPEAQDAKESMQRQLLRTMASKMYAAAQEEERTRRIKEMKEPDDDLVKKKAFQDLMRVQEDMVRAVNVMKVKAECELEQAQRITAAKKESVHAELIRKSSAKEVDRLADEEKQRRIDAEKGDYDQDRQKTYGKLVTVQEDLLKHIRKMKADHDIKLEQERRILEGKKQVVQEQLIHSVGQKNADSEMDKEKSRRTESLSDEEIERIQAIGVKMIDVQKELLAKQEQTKPIKGTVSQEVLEEAKAFLQEQIRRKAAQKEAIVLMDEEQKRRIADATSHNMSDAQADLMEAISRKAGVKTAKQMADTTQKEYMQAEMKARSQEDTVRKVNQKVVDKAMDEEQSDRIQESSGKDQPKVAQEIKQAIQGRTN